MWILNLVGRRWNEAYCMQFEACSINYLYTSSSTRDMPFLFNRWCALRLRWCHKETWTCHRNLERFARAWTRCYVKKATKSLALLKTDDLKLKHVLQSTWRVKQRRKIGYVKLQHVNWSWCGREGDKVAFEYLNFKRAANICILIIISCSRCFAEWTIYYSDKLCPACGDAMGGTVQWEGYLKL